MLWLVVPTILFVAGFILAVLAQGSARIWVWASGAIFGILLMVTGMVMLAALLLLGVY